MAITILPQSTGGFFSGLGSGLGQGLQLLAENKLEDIQARRLIPAVKALFPQWSDEQAAAFAKSPPVVQKEIIKQLVPAMQASPVESAFEDILGGGIPQSQMQSMPQLSFEDIIPQQASPLQQGAPSPQQLQQVSHLLSTPQGLQSMMGMPQAAALQQLPQAPISQQREPAISQEQMSLSQREQEQQNLERYIQQSNLSHRQKAQLRDRFEKRHEKMRKEELESFKFTKEDRKKIFEAAQAAKSNLRDLERFEELEKEGKLDTAGYNEFLKRSGLDVQALRNPGSEEFIKLQNNFIRNAKNIYGARISNFEVEQFLKTLPDLSQSPEGRKRILSAMKQNARASIAYSEAAKEVIREHKGTPPLDFLERIDDKIGKKLDKIAKQFKKDLNKPVPPAQNRAITAAQTIAGGLVGRIPGVARGALAGAGAGALYGSRGGPIGTLGGALGGGIAGLLGLI